MSLYIFHRDLRIIDNTALFKCLLESDKVIPCFIFTQEQISDENKFKSNNCLQYMLESLLDLDKYIKHVNSNSGLLTICGKYPEVLDEIRSRTDFSAIYSTLDYTPYATKRDDIIAEWCKVHNIEFFTYEDILLNPIINDKILTKSGNPYQKFTPYYNSATKLRAEKPKKISKDHYKKFTAYKSTCLQRIWKELPKNNKIEFRGGRTQAIKNIKDSCGISAINKFGCLSIREVYWILKKQEKEKIRGLYWRDFYYRIAWYFPYVISGKNRNFKEKYGKIDWVKNPASFSAWCEGKTGFPIVDASMRHMNTTGFMENRMRLIAASFLIKDLHINWEEGERYFATKLIDYDPCQNNGNWQWVAGSGVDSQPYYRIFNPWHQSEKYDTDAEFIKEWVPELSAVSAHDIHNWYTNHKKYEQIAYPKPILDHDDEKKVALELVKKIYE